ncbi:MAG: hypothetical protein GY771_08070, partial [bacterium]|nr:hypothetical protein [bacterium]
MKQSILSQVALLAIATAAVVLSAVSAQARIKLTTLPEREAVLIDIQNGRYTLV